MASKAFKNLFVIMPFRAEFDDVYMVVRDACNDRSLSVRIDCVRADEISKPGLITDQVRDAIENCDAIVADLTGSNPNVMYELGYGHALRKPTIILNQSVKDSPFDVQGMRQIVYDRNRLVKDCRPRLVTSIEEVLGSEGPVELEETDIGPADPYALESHAAELAVSHAPLMPSERLVAELQALHLRLQLLRGTSDMAGLQKLARDVIATVDRITVPHAIDNADLRNTVATIGNCAVELERASLFQEAEDLYKRGIGLHPKYPGIHFQYADYLVDQGRLEEASEELQVGRELDANDRRIPSLETKLGVATGQVDPSLGGRLRDLFEMDKSKLTSAVAYLQFLDRTNASAEEFERVCTEWEEAAPESEKSVARRALADYLASHGVHERAKGLYEELLKTAGGEDRYQILHNVATVCDSLGFRDDAEKYWREAYQANPSDFAVRAAFSQRLARWGKLAEAVAVSEGKPIE